MKRVRGFVWIQVSVLGAAILVIIMCAKPGTKQTSSSPQSSTSSSDDNAAQSLTPVVSVSSSARSTTSSSLTVQLANKFTPASVQGYLIGHANQYIMISSKSTSNYLIYTISGVVPGTYELLVTASLPSGGSSTAAVGKRISNITITANPATVRVDSLEPCGSISGKVTLQSQSAFSDVTAQLAGTKLQAMSGADGSYVIKAVPMGIYRIDFTKSGYAAGAAENIAVVDVGPVKVNDITLTNPSFVGAGAVLSSLDDTAAKIILIPTGDAHYMRFAESTNLGGQTWQPLVTTLTYTPQNHGAVFYVQFSPKDTNDNISAMIALPLVAP